MKIYVVRPLKKFRDIGNPLANCGTLQRPATNPLSVVWKKKVETFLMVFRVLKSGI
jgi:hypothetical protein